AHEVARRAKGRGDGRDVEEDLVAAAVVLGGRHGLDVEDVHVAGRVVVVLDGGPDLRVRERDGGQGARLPGGQVGGAVEAPVGPEAEGEVVFVGGSPGARHVVVAGQGVGPVVAASGGVRHAARGDGLAGARGWVELGELATHEAPGDLLAPG